MVGGLPDVELRVWPPSSSDYWRVSGDPLVLRENASFPTELSIDITDHWERYADEDEPNNPAQRGSYYEVWDRGVCKSRGKVVSAGREQESGQARVILRGLDKLDVLNRTFALGRNGEYVWSRETPSLAKSQTTLLAGYFSDFGDGRSFVWWPTPDDSTSGLWISTAASNVTDLGQNMTNAPSPANGGRIKLTQDFPAFPPQGFVTINSEWIEYKGLAQDTADDFWYLHNIRRGALGTTIGNHSSGDDVYLRLPKRINPRGRVLLEGNNAGTWELIPLNNHAKVNYEAGAFSFGRNPLTLLTGGTYTALRATDEIFDEEGGSQITLFDILLQVLGGDPALGGPGFGGGYTDPATIDIDTALQDVKITRVVVKEATTCMDFIKGLLAELDLARGTPDDAVVIGYDPENDSIFVRYVRQKDPAAALAADRPERTYFGEASRSEDNSSQLARTAMLVAFEAVQEFNLATMRGTWHTVGDIPQAGVGSPGGGAVPYVYQKFNGTWGVPVTMQPGSYNSTQLTVAGWAPPTLELLTDNNAQSGFMLAWDTLQAAGTHMYWWFPGSSDTAPDTWFIRRVVLSLGLWGTAVGAAGGQAYFGVEVRGFEGFTGSTSTSAPTANDEVPISVKLCADAIGTFSTEQELRLEADGLFIPCQALGLKVHGYLDVNGLSALFGGADEGRYCFIVNDILIEGVRKRHVLVELTGTYGSGDFGTLVAPESAAKLLDVHMGQHDAELLDIGQGSAEVAYMFGFIALLQSLAQAQAVDYTIASVSLDREGTGHAGETFAFSDGFVGVADTVDIAYSGGLRVMSCRAVNYREDIVGSISCARLPPPRDPELRRSEELNRIASAKGRFITLEATE